MNRRNFINTTTLAGLGLTSNSFIVDSFKLKEKELRGTFSQTGNRISIYTKAAIKPTRILHITDTHLSIDDERGINYQEYSKRMAGAYKSNTHFQTSEKYSTKESFEITLEFAKKEKVDFLALTGDIFSYDYFRPSLPLAFTVIITVIVNKNNFICMHAIRIIQVSYLRPFIWPFRTFDRQGF